jgi:imidazolonepropionase-like amidohydrolase
MRNSAIFIATLLVAIAISGQRQTPPSGASLALTNANVVNVRNGQVVAGVTIVLRNGRIESIGHSGLPTDVTVIDLKGKYVLPGLIDGHSHAQDIAAFRRALESGVTTLRSAGVPNYADAGFRELVRRGAFAGPDIVACGYHIRPQMAPEAFLNHPEYSDLMSGLNTVEKLRRAVQMNLSHHVDWIKIIATGRAGIPSEDPRQQFYSEAEIRAVVQEAATAGLPVEVHAHGDEGAMAAVKAGARSIEHGTYLSDETLQLMKANGVYLDPTYSILAKGAEGMSDQAALAARAAAAGTVPDPTATHLRELHMRPRLRDTIVRAHKMGLRIVTGTDEGYGPASLVRISREMAEFVEMGFTPLEAIQSATIVNAEMLKLEKAIGVLEPGYEADLIVVDQNPLEDIITVQDPLLVVSNGRVALNRLSPTRPSSPNPSR